MNWSVYSRFVGNVFGAPLAIEGLAAFMLESTFLGLWIFGWNRLSPRVHLATLWIAVARHLAVGLLHPRRELVDAASGRLQDRQRGGAADEHLGAARRTHSRCYAFLHTILAGLIFGSVAGARRLLLALPARPQRRALPHGGQAGADRRWCRSRCSSSSFGSRFGEAVTSAQPMKIAATEAQWNTCQPCGVLAVPDRRVHQERRDPELLDRDPAGCSRTWPPARSTARCQGLNQLQAEGAAPVRAAATTCPESGSIYWSHAGDGLRGRAHALRSPWSGPGSTGSGSSSGRRWFQRTAIAAIALPFLACDLRAGCLTEIGPPAVDRAGAAEDEQARTRRP